MAVILEDIYRETKEKYGLKLLAGEGGLDAEMNWVYVAESYVGGGYLHGGELIITTGVLCRESPQWLYHFIESMIGEHTCGLILNIGRYVWPAHITREILDLCARNHYPLFTMPWETLLADVTRDYYNRIFNDSQRNETVTSAFLNLVHGRAADEQVSLLEEYGFPAQGYYRAVYVRYSLPETDSQQKRMDESHFRLVLSRLFRESGLPGHLCCSDGYTLIICLVSHSFAEENLPLSSLLQKNPLSGSADANVRSSATASAAAKANSSAIASAAVSKGKVLDFPAQWAENLANTLASHFSKATVFVGSGSLQDSLAGLPESFFHAKAAASYAAALFGEMKKRSAAFQNLGFYRILLSVSDRKALRDYADGLLQPVLSRDAARRSDYAATLREYLRRDGSVQAVADALYCHRNTINKRIRVLKEDFGFRLDDPRTRFELTAAFEIQNFLRVFPEEEKSSGR